MGSTCYVTQPGCPWPGTHSLHLPCLDQGAPPPGFGTSGSIDLSQVPFCVSPLQSFSTGRDSAPTPTPGDVWRHLETFLYDQGRGCYRHLVDGGRGYCSTSSSVQNSLHRRELSCPAYSHPKTGKPWLGLIGSFIEQSAGIMSKGRRR